MCSCNNVGELRASLESHESHETHLNSTHAHEHSNHNRYVSQYVRYDFCFFFSILFINFFFRLNDIDLELASYFILFG